MRSSPGTALSLYSGMNGSLGKILAGYRENELEVIADFLRRIADAGRDAADELAVREPARPNARID